jgi:hypothetical protein
MGTLEVMWLSEQWEGDTARTCTEPRGFEFQEWSCQFPVVGNVQVDILEWYICERPFF